MGIIRRTALYENLRVNGENYILPYDWALTITTLGMCAEPFTIGARARVGGGPDYPALVRNEEMTMINEFQMVDSTKPYALLGENVHGGNMVPRSGR